MFRTILFDHLRLSCIFILIDIYTRSSKSTLMEYSMPSSCTLIRTDYRFLDYVIASQASLLDVHVVPPYNMKNRYVDRGA